MPNGWAGLELTRNPHRLEAHLGDVKSGDWVVLDGIQKIPALLDEVHRLMEGRRLRFALCGSSARKLKRDGANLLAGRALLREMEGFVSSELGEDFDLERAQQWGTLPIVTESRGDEAEILESYVHTYIEQEIKLTYYHTASGVEIDFIIETRKRREGAKPAVVCVEVKSAERWDPSWNRAMLDLDASGRVQVDGLYGVYQGDRRLRFDSVRVLPVKDFLSHLHAGDVY